MLANCGVRDMNHSVTLTFVAIVAATTLTGVVFAIPQQALAYKHHHHNNHIKVDQQINQLNQCTGAPPDNIKGTLEQFSSTVCVNQGDNSADIHRCMSHRVVDLVTLAET
jgi:hypothetical protein